VEPTRKSNPLSKSRFDFAGTVKTEAPNFQEFARKFCNYCVGECVNRSPSLLELPVLFRALKSNPRLCKTLRSFLLSEYGSTEDASRVKYNRSRDAQVIEDVVISGILEYFLIYRSTAQQWRDCLKRIPCCPEYSHDPLTVVFIGQTESFWPLFPSAIGRSAFCLNVDGLFVALMILLPSE
jgi:hypothetical protein